MTKKIETYLQRKLINRQMIAFQDDIAAIHSGPLQTMLKNQIVSLSHAILDLSRVVLDLSQAVLDLSQAALDLPYAILDLPQAVLDLLHAILDLPHTVLDLPHIVLDFLPKDHGLTTIRIVLANLYVLYCISILKHK